MTDLCGMWGPPNGWLCREPKGHDGQHVWRPSPEQMDQPIPGTVDMEGRPGPTVWGGKTDIEAGFHFIRKENGDICYTNITAIGGTYNRSNTHKHARMGADGSEEGHHFPTLVCTASGMTTQILVWPETPRPQVMEDRHMTELDTLIERMKIAAAEMQGMSGEGALHIFVADGNCDDEHLEFCLEQPNITPSEAEFCGRMLSDFSDVQRAGIYAFTEMMPASGR